MAKRIIVTQVLDLFPDQIKRLNGLGEVKIYNDVAKTPQAWLDRCRGFDVICTGKFGLTQMVYELENVFISLPFVGVGWLDLNKLKKRNITVAYAPGCNKDAVSEWIIAMMLNLSRNLPKFINVKRLPAHVLPERTIGLTGKAVCILGAGNIGTRVGKICGALDMKVIIFKKGDDLIQKAHGADFVVNCLSENPTTLGLLNREFFSSLKRGSFFVSVTSQKLYDTRALISLVGKNIAGAAIDVGDMPQSGDTSFPFYKELLKNERIMATPHIAFNTDVTARVANDMMIANIAAYLNGRPINLINLDQI